ncbi:transcription initiation factor TFIID subunit 4B [Rhinophrynus dorsalis]
MHTNQAAPSVPSVVNHGVPAAPSLLTKTFIGTTNSEITITGTQSTASVTLTPAAPSSVLSTPKCTVLAKVAQVNVTSQSAKVTSGSRVTAPLQPLPPKTPPTAAIQLPANFQIPPGTVLIRSGNGQLMLVSQQALARAQAQIQSSGARPPVPTNTPTLQLCTLQNSGTQLLSNLANSTVKTSPTSAPLTSISVMPTVQRSPSVLQSAPATCNVVKVTSSMGCRQSTPPVSMPAVVRICTPSTVQTGAAAPNQANSAVIIRAPAPIATPVNALSCAPATTSATSSSPVVIPATSAMGTATTSITMLPIRASTPLVTPITINACTSVVIPSTTITPSVSGNVLSTTLPASVRISTSSGSPAIKTYVPANTLTSATCGSTVKLATTNVCITTTAAGTSSPVFTSNTIQASSVVTPMMSGNKVPTIMPAEVRATALPGTPNVISCKAVPTKMTPKTQHPSSPEILDNVKKCKNFLATLIKLASSGPQSPTMGQNVKNLVKSLLDSDIEPEEFTTKLYKELKSSPQPYLVPFLKKSLPALRRLMPNSQDFIMQCGQPTSSNSVSVPSSLSFVKITPTPSFQTVKQVGVTTLNSAKVKQTTSALTQPVNTLKTVNIKQLVVQQPTGGIVKHVAALPQTSALSVQKPGEKRISLNALIQAGHLPPASVLKQITLPGNKVISLQSSPLPVKENSAPCFREEDDINDVTSMAGVNLIEETACILATNSELVGAVIRSCKDEPFLFTAALKSRILDIGKRHDIKELNSDVMNLVSHATQERLRGLIEKLTVAAQHRSANYKQSDRYLKSSDVKAQLKFLEQLEHLEKQRKNEEEREMLLRAAKSRANREDPEQLRLKQKAKEMQQLELEQMQYREANLTALAAIGPRKKRPLESLCLQNGLEESNASGSSVFGLSKSLLVPRITRVSLRDLIFCLEQERETKHSLSLYRALLK